MNENTCIGVWPKSMNSLTTGGQGVTFPLPKEHICKFNWGTACFPAVYTCMICGKAEPEPESKPKPKAKAKPKPKPEHTVFTQCPHCDQSIQLTVKRDLGRGLDTAKVTCQDPLSITIDLNISLSRGK